MKDKTNQPFSELFEELPDQVEANDAKELDKVRVRKRLGDNAYDKDMAELKEGESAMDEFFAKITAKKELDAEKYKAYEFLFCMRGQYIMAQALHVAIKAMKEVPSPRTEHSNIADMEFIRDKIFNFPIQSLEEMEQQFREAMLQQKTTTAS